VKAPKPCLHPACGVLTNKPYCIEHMREPVQRPKDDARPSADKRGYGNAWRKARLGYLKSHPLCVHHQERGFTVASNEVDHIIDHKGDQALFWDKENWQALCKSCHSKKTAKTMDRNRQGVGCYDKL